MLDLEFWKIFVSLGVPGLALGVFFMLFRQFSWRFPAVPRAWVAPIIILFMLLTSGLMLTALVLWAPKPTNPEYSTNDGEGTEGNKEEPIDRTDARETAKAVLEAYQNRNVIKLASLSFLDNRQIIDELKIQGVNHPRFKSLFEGWRWQMVEPWDGSVGEARYEGSSGGQVTAMVKFESISPNELAVVTLHWGDGQWYFEDIHSPDADDFYSLSKVLVK